MRFAPNRCSSSNALMTNKAFHLRGVTKLVAALFGYGGTLTYPLAGHRNLLHRANAQ